MEFHQIADCRGVAQGLDAFNCLCAAVEANRCKTVLRSRNDQTSSAAADIEPDHAVAHPALLLQVTLYAFHGGCPARAFLVQVQAGYLHGVRLAEKQRKALRRKVIAGVNVFTRLAVHPIELGRQTFLPDGVVFATIAAQQGRIRAGAQRAGLVGDPQW